MPRPIPLSDSISSSSSRPTSPTPSPPPSMVQFEIPVFDFSPSRSRSIPITTPPRRLINQSPSTTPTSHWRQRLAEAEASRNASLASMTDRCRAHMEHVAQVVANVSATRRAELAAKEQHLSSSLRCASERRQQILKAKAGDPTEERVRRARSARDAFARQRRGDAQEAASSRREAAARRSRLLTERKHRAARFSPPLTQDESMLTQEVPSPGSTVASESDNEEDGRRLSFCSEQFGPEGCLPAAAADVQMTPTREQNVEVDKEVKKRAIQVISIYVLLWRARNALRNAGIIGVQVSGYSFQKVTERMESEIALRAAELILRVVDREDENLGDMRRRQNDRRILLCCLLMALHPKAVMEEKVFGDGVGSSKKEMHTLFCARRMLLCLHNGSLLMLRDAWVRWRHAFLAWKKADSEKLLNAMIEDAVATEAMRLAVSSRFSHSLVVDDVHHTLQGSSSAQDAAKRDYQIWEEQITLKQDKIREAVIKLAGNQGMNKLDAALSSAKHVKNEHLVHEILLDLPGLLQRVREPAEVSQQEWEQLYFDLSATPPRTNVLARRIADISQSLNNLISECFSMNDNIGPINLDVEFAVNYVIQVASALKRCQAEAYDEALDEWLREAVNRLQNSGNELPENIVKTMQELTRFVRTVQVDVLSFRVRHAAPIVDQYGPAWERSHFQGHIISGKFDEELPRTLTMLQSILADIVPELPVSNKQLLSGEPRATRNVITHGFVQLTARLEMMTVDDLPEICHLDLQRITELQNDLQRCTFLACLHNFGTQFLGTKEVIPDGNGFEELVRVTAKQESGLREMESTFVEWVRNEANDKNVQLEESDEVLLRNLLKGLGRPEDELFALMHRRVQKAIVEVTIRANSGNRRQSRASAASALVDNNSSSDRHSVLGLDSIDFLVRDVSQRLGKLVLHTTRIHGATLLKLFKRIISDEY